MLQEWRKDSLLASFASFVRSEQRICGLPTVEIKSFGTRKRIQQMPEVLRPVWVAIGIKKTPMCNTVVLRALELVCLYPNLSICQEEVASPRGAVLIPAPQGGLRPTNQRYQRISEIDEYQFQRSIAELREECGKSISMSFEREGQATLTNIFFKECYTFLLAPLYPNARL